LVGFLKSIDLRNAINSARKRRGLFEYEYCCAGYEYESSEGEEDEEYRA
jgi:hypothetical protein